MADLVIGRALIDVKLVIEPSAKDVAKRERQVLGYVLLDRHNVLHVNEVTIYCAWQARLLTYPLATLLAAPDSLGPPDLETLRIDFHDVLNKELDGYLAWKERQHYRCTPD